MNFTLNSLFFSFSCFVFVCLSVFMYVCTYVCTLGDSEPEGTAAPTAIHGQYSTEDPSNKNYDTKKAQTLKMKN